MQNPLEKSTIVYCCLNLTKLQSFLLKENFSIVEKKAAEPLVKEEAEMFLQAVLQEYFLY